MKTVHRNDTVDNNRETPSISISEWFKTILLVIGICSVAHYLRYHIYDGTRYTDFVLILGPCLVITLFLLEPYRKSIEWCIVKMHTTTEWFLRRIF